MSDVEVYFGIDCSDDKIAQLHRDGDLGELMLRIQLRAVSNQNATGTALLFSNEEMKAIYRQQVSHSKRIADALEDLLTLIQGDRYMMGRERKID